MKLRIRDRRRRIESNLAIRVDVARDQKIVDSWRVGLQPWRGVLDSALAPATTAAEMLNISQRWMRLMKSDVDRPAASCGDARRLAEDC